MKSWCHVNTDNRRALPYVLLLGFVLASTLVVSRYSLGQFHPFLYITLRLVFANVVVGSDFVIWRRRKFPRDRKLWWHGTILGVLSALPLIGFVASLQYQSSGVTSILNTLMPVGLVLAAHYFLVDEPLRWNKLAGALVAFSGAAFLLLRGETGLAGIAQADWRGYALVGLAMLSNIISAIYTRLYLRQVNVIDISGIRLLVSLVIMGALTLFAAGFDFSRVEPAGVAAVIYAGTIGTTGGIVLYFWVIQRFGATIASLTEYVVPLITSILGVVFLGEIFTLPMLVGMLLIFAGINLMNRKVV